MAKYVKKPIIVEATQWFTNGDHPEDDCREIPIENGGYLSEGKVVRYYRHPDLDGEEECKYCGEIMHYHGWIDTLEGGHIVCPGDWVITGISGEKYPVKNSIFEQTYEKFDE